MHLTTLARRIASWLPPGMLVAMLRSGRRMGPSRLQWPAWLAFAYANLGESRRASGDLHGAVDAFQAALREADASDATWPLHRKQQWEFRLELIRHELGRRRVSDPLFECTISPPPPVGVAEHGPLDTFAAHLTYLGISLTGRVRSSVGSVAVYVDDACLRTINVSHEGHTGKVNLTIKRRTLDHFPHRSRISLRADDGTVLRTRDNSTAVDLVVPHGSGTVKELLERGRRLDKKGSISLTHEAVRDRQELDLATYGQVRRFFSDRLGRPLFLMYGTLLGYYRDGDLIPTDDDFDVSYVSDKTDPVAVKEETKDVIVELIRAGYTVSFNRRGRLFRVQLGDGPDHESHIDVHPIWFQDGHAWAHNLLCIPATREDFLPAATGTLRNTTVATPRSPEVLLHGNYGPGWKVPDPGFRYYASAVPPAVRENLARALITVDEYKQLAARIADAVHGQPTAGRLVSLGSQDLYPLDRFIS